MQVPNALWVVAFVGLSWSSVAETPKAPAAPKPDAASILVQLKEGNERFRAGVAKGPHRDLPRVALAANVDQGDHALATVLTCSDSRLPVELIMDTGIMDLFVVRVAGNVADGDEIGTMEYGVTAVRTSLVVVLGHTGCGAVKAVLQSRQGQALDLSPNLKALVENITPAVDRVLGTPDHKAAPNMLRAAVEENVWQSVHDMLANSPIIRKLLQEGKIKVVGAVYNLDTAAIDWLDESRPLAIANSLGQPAPLPVESAPAPAP